VRTGWMTLVSMAVTMALAPAGPQTQDPAYSHKWSYAGANGPNIGVIWIRSTPPALQASNSLRSTFEMRKKNHSPP